MALQEELEVQGNFLFRYRGILPIAILATGLLIFFVCDPHPYAGLTWRYELLCMLVSLTGLIIRMFTVAYRFRGTSGRNTHKQVADRLNTSGIYSQVRHPLYLGNFFMSLGLALLVRNYWFLLLFITVYWIYYERIMYAEEQFLRKRFGEQYLRWAAVTPAIFPAFKNWIRPELQVNWWTVFRNESNSFLSLCAVFLVFEAMEKVKQYNMPDVVGSWQFYMCAFALLCYGSVKVINRIKHVLT